MAYYEQAVELSPHSAQILDEYGQVYYLMGNDEQALAVYNQSLAVDAKYAQTYLLIGDLQLHAEAWQAAIDQYTKALALDETQTAGWSAMAYAYNKLGDIDKAIEANLKVLELAPTDYDTLKNVALLYQSKGDLTQSLVYAQQALQVSTGDQTTLMTQFIQELQARHQQQQCGSVTMTQYVLIGISAFILAVSATPVLRWLAPKLGVVDQPSARKVHTRPMPLMGGVAIYLAFMAALFLAGDRFYVRQVAGILLGATLCSLMGFIDDRRGLSAAVKLMGQAVAGGILVLSGVQVQLFAVQAANIALTLFWVVGITNAMNLLDNMDGLSGGVAAVAAAFLLLLAALSGQYLVGALAAGLLGACIGFLVYNINPASIFMGDTGSLFIGLILAALGIKVRFPSNVTFVTWMIPVMVLGVPIFDTTLVFFSRIRRHLNPLTTPGKDHLSHRLVRLGLSPREAVLVIYLIGCGFGLLATFLTQADAVLGYTTGGIVVAAGIYCIARLERKDLIG